MSLGGGINVADACRLIEQGFYAPDRMPSTVQAVASGTHDPSNATRHRPANCFTMMCSRVASAVRRLADSAPVPLRWPHGPD